MDDFDLLRAYALERKEEAFTTLTSRYVNLVYSAARRQSSDAQAAEDIMQAVFLTLARKAGSISRGTILAGWLLRTTRLAAANARRLQQRRQHYEQQVMHSYVCPTETEAAWQRVAPLLDDALERLGGKDRDAVVLRFFEGKPLKDVARQLGTSEDGAQKRISRAIRKLRLHFARHGKTVSGAVLMSMLAANSVQAAPPGLAASLSAFITSNSVLATSAVANLADATAAALARAKLQFLALRAGGVAALLTVAVLTVPRVNQSAESAPPTAATETTITETLPQTIEAPTLLAATAAPQPRTAQILFRVVDSQSQSPVPDVRLTLVSVVESPRRVTNTFITDIYGESVIDYSPMPVKSWSHRIEVFRDGYVPKYVSWSESQQDRIEEIPAEYKVAIEPAVTIGGVVLDELDAAIPGLAVVFSVSGPTASRARERLTMMGDYHTETTDGQGRWRCTHVPARFGMIDYKLVHPSFQEKTYASGSPDSPNYINIDRIPQADLLAQRAVMRVKRGLVIAGIVTDESGRPVSGAKVTQNYDFRHRERNVFTGTDGSFRFENGRDRLSLTVQAEQLAPVVTSFVMKASIEDLHIVLPSGRALAGRVVDEAGEPIGGATVEAASPTADSRRLFEWRAKTDANGSFRWDIAPASQEYAVYASGYETAPRVTLDAQTANQVVQLKKKASSSVRILGQVIDAETKSPPAAAQVQIWQTTTEPGGRTSTFTTRAEDVAPDGQFRLKTSSGTLSYVLEATAEGYWPERVTNQVTSASEVRVSLELKKAPLSAGVVLTPAGEPAAGAMVVVCGRNEWAQMGQSGGLHLGPGNNKTGVAADAQGRFRLPPKHAPEVVVIAHAAGFAEVPFSSVTSNTTVTLQPWGRIEGVATLGGKPLTGETMRLNGMPWPRNLSPRVSLYMGAQPDAEGKFFFETVPPGEWKLDHELKTSERPAGFIPPAYSHGVAVLVRPGETARVVIGGNGRPVIGKAVPADPERSVAWTANTAALILKVAATGAPREPVRGNYRSDEEFTAAQAAYGQRSRAYWTSEEGLALQRVKREYRAFFNSEGAFRMEDVPPGDYTLKISLIDPPKRPGPDFMANTAIAALEMDVTIPAASSDSEGAPVDLGLLHLNPAPTVEASGVR